VKEYTLSELAYRAKLKNRRIDLLMETMYLAARGLPEDYKQIDELDVEIDKITAELEGRERLADQPAPIWRGKRVRRRAVGGVMAGNLR
jgi:hypothetical protein